MNDITNKHIFFTMIIIGLVTIGLIIPLYGNKSGTATQYSYSSGTSNTNLNGNTLSANAYNADYSGPQTNLLLGSNGQPYQPVITKSYVPGNYTTTDYNYSGSSYPTYQTYTTYDQQNTNYSSSTGYVPAGCESGTDYSLTTGEPCG